MNGLMSVAHAGFEVVLSPRDKKPSAAVLDELRRLGFSSTCGIEFEFRGDAEAYLMAIPVGAPEAMLERHAMSRIVAVRRMTAHEILDRELDPRPRSLCLAAGPAGPADRRR